MRDENDEIDEMKLMIKWKWMFWIMKIIKWKYLNDNWFNVLNMYLEMYRLISKPRKKPRKINNNCEGIPWEIGNFLADSGLKILMFRSYIYAVCVYLWYSDVGIPWEIGNFLAWVGAENTDVLELLLIWGKILGKL